MKRRRAVKTKAPQPGTRRKAASSAVTEGVATEGQVTQIRKGAAAWTPPRAVWRTDEQDAAIKRRHQQTGFRQGAGTFLSMSAPQLETLITSLEKDMAQRNLKRPKGKHAKPAAPAAPSRTDRRPTRGGDRHGKA